MVDNFREEIDEPEPEPEPTPFTAPHAPTEAELAQKREKQAEEVSAHEAAERAGTITPEQRAVLDADLQEVIKWEKARDAAARLEAAADAVEPQYTLAAALDLLGTSMGQAASDQEVVESEPAEPLPYAPQPSAELQDALDAKRAAKLAELRAARAAYYAPQPEIPGRQQGFEREM